MSERACLRAAADHGLQRDGGGSGADVPVREVAQSIHVAFPGAMTQVYEVVGDGIHMFTSRGPTVQRPEIQVALGECLGTANLQRDLRTGEWI